MIGLFFFNVFLNLPEWLVVGGGMWNLHPQHKLLITDELLGRAPILPFHYPHRRKAVTI